MAARTLIVGALLLGLAPVARAATNDYLADADRLIAAGDLKAARIQLMNAVRAEPQNMAGHYRLGGVDLDLGDPVAAEHEARVAQDGGYDAGASALLLARALLAEGRYREVLDHLAATAGSAEQRARVLVLRGEAQLALDRTVAAKASFDEAQRLAPGSAEPILAQARLAAQARDFAAAGALFDKALALAPQSIGAVLGKASLLRRHGDLLGALHLVDGVAKTHPQVLRLLLARAEILLDLDDKKRAAADIAAVLGEQPSNAAAVYLRAILHAKEADFKAADADLDRLSGVLDRLPRGYYVLAVVKSNLGQLSQAEDAARRYVGRNPDDAAGKKLLARIALERGEPAEVVAALDAARSPGTADPETLGLLGRADLESGRSQVAAGAFEAALKKAPDDPSLHYWLGVSRLQAGETEAGVAQLTRSLDLAPNAPAGALLVVADIAAGRNDAAMQVVDSLRRADPKSPMPGNLAGMVKLAEFDLAGARAAFAAVAAKHPDFVPARLYLARVADLQGKADEARGLLERILADQPANAQALTQLVDLLLRDGKKAEAVAAAERAHAAAPNSTVIAGGLVDLYLRLGDTNKALAVARTESGQNDARNVPLIAARARAETAAGLLADAAQTYRRLVAIDGASIANRRRLAAVLLAAGDTTAARVANEAALKAAPGNPQLVADRLDIEAKAGGVPAALAWATTYGSQHPDLPEAAALEGDALMAAGEPGKAEAAYRSAYGVKPSALLALRAFRAATAGGDATGGAQLMRAWLARHPDDLTVAAELGAADITARRFDEARSLLEAIAAKQPQNPVTLNNLAWLYHLTGDPRALALAERAYALAPHVGAIAETLGWILTKAKRPGDAIGLLQQASAAVPASPTIKYRLAVALNDTGDAGAARRLLSSIVSAPANFDEKPAARQLLAELGQ